MQALRRLARYLNGTRDFYVAWTRTTDVAQQGWSVVLEGWSDSDWAQDTESRKSRSSFHIECNGCAMGGSRRRQAVVATSSGEAEYAALVDRAEQKKKSEES